MQTVQHENNPMQIQENIWSLVSKKDFAGVIAGLVDKGVADEDLGESLFAFAKQAMAEQRLTAARTILSFLLDALEDKAEAPPLLKLIGDIFTAEGAHEKAREYYGRLPATLGNIKLCLYTFLPARDVDGLLAVRDSVLVGMLESNHAKVHAIVDEIMMEIAANSGISEEQDRLYKENVEVLEKIDPFGSNPELLQGILPNDLSNQAQVSLKLTENKIYAKQKDHWQRLLYQQSHCKPVIENLHRGKNIITRCASLLSFVTFVESVKAGTPGVVKFECLVILDFQLLRAVADFWDLSPLANCNFVIRLLDENKFEAGMKNLLLDQKIVFPSLYVDLLGESSLFFKQQVTPVLSKCEAIIVSKVKLYEQKFTELFPKDYQNKVASRINEHKKIRILLMTTRYSTYVQYSTRDMADGFRQLGCEVLIHQEEEGGGVGVRKDVGMKDLLEFKPDLIFAIDHMRFEFPWIPKTIPFVVWVQDFLSSFTQVTDPEMIDNHDYIFCFNQRGCDYFKQHSVFQRKKCRLLPIPLNKGQYYPIEDLEKEHDVTYVSHLFDPEVTLQPFREGRIPEGVTDEFDIIFYQQVVKDLELLYLSDVWRIISDLDFRRQFAEGVCRNAGLSFSDDLLGKLAGEYEIDGELRRFYLDVHLYLKVRPILYLLENGIDVRVYGKNWQKIPGLEAVAMGPIENGDIMNKLINQTRINLNLSTDASYQMRAPEVMGAKGFMLSRYIWGDSLPIINLFKEGEEVVVFKDEKDLLTKVRYYLDHEDEREQIASNAYSRLLAEYTFSKEADKILAVIASDANNCS